MSGYYLWIADCSLLQISLAITSYVFLINILCSLLEQILDHLHYGSSLLRILRKKRVSFSEEGMKDYLLFGEKVVLSKLTLENLPIYYSVIPHKFSKSVMQTLGRTSHAHSPNFGPPKKGTFLLASYIQG